MSMYTRFIGERSGPPPCGASGKALGPRVPRNQGWPARGPEGKVIPERWGRGLARSSGSGGGGTAARGRSAAADSRAMLGRACGRLAPVLRLACAQVSRRPLHSSGRRLRADGSERPQAPPRAFDPALLEFLVCPLSKKPLRYEASTNELINEELGIAYPIIDGIPNMIPQAARSTRQSEKQEDAEQP